MYKSASSSLLALTLMACAASRAFTRGERAAARRGLGHRGRVLPAGRPGRSGSRGVQDRARAGDVRGGRRCTPIARGRRKRKAGSTRRCASIAAPSELDRAATGRSPPRRRNSNASFANESRPRARGREIDKLREQARRLSPEPLLNPTPAARAGALQQRQHPRHPHLHGRADGHQRHLRSRLSGPADHRQPRRRDAGAGAPADHADQSAVLQSAERAHDHRGAGHHRRSARSTKSRSCGPSSCRTPTRPKWRRFSTSCASPAWPIQPQRRRPTRRPTRSSCARPTPVMDIIERMIEANDKPRAEVVIDVQILEVSPRAREAVRPQPQRLCHRWHLLAGSSPRRPAYGHGGGVAPTERRIAAAIQPQHDLAGHQHRRLLSDGARAPC